MVQQPLQNALIFLNKSAIFVLDLIPDNAVVESGASTPPREVLKFWSQCFINLITILITMF